MNKIVVIGAGITGLATTYKLAKDGYDVTLIESSSQLGGLGTFFKHGENWIDKFYHCQMPSDNSLLKLIDDVGLMDQLYWRPTHMGFIVDSKHYPFNSATDLLKFDAISFVERVRFGIISLLLRQLGKGKDLDNLPIEKWFVKLYGKNIWNKILKHLFLSKFGDHSGNLPSLYIWERLGREKNIATRGYLKCGLKGFIDKLAEKIIEYGGEIKLNSKVNLLSKSEIGINVEVNDETINADWVISTIPFPQFSHLINKTNLKEHYNLPKLRYQGVVNVLFFLKRPLDNYYWTPVVDSGAEFDGVVEMTELVDKTIYGNNHMVYTMKYCEKDSPLFNDTPETIIERWKKQLIDLYKNVGLTENDIIDAKIFKAPYVEPIYPLGYSKIKPEMNVDGVNIILATAAQVYPKITSWNASTNLSNEAVRLLYKLNNASPTAKGKMNYENVV